MDRNYPNAKGLIFDLDGTLVDSMPVHKIAWKEVSALKNFNFTDEIFYRYAGVPSEKIFSMINETYGTDFDPEYHSKLKEEAYQKKMSMVRPIEKVLEVVKYNYKVVPMAIGTGSPRSQSLEILELLNLTKYFEAIVTKDDVKLGKPAPDTFLLCAELMKVETHACVVFEDGDPGLEAARSAGMKTIDIREHI